LAQIICAVLAVGVSIAFLYVNKLFPGTDTVKTISLLVRWAIFWFAVFFLLTTVLFSHKILSGKFQEILLFVATSVLISLALGYVAYALYKSGLDFKRLDWFTFLRSICEFSDLLFYGMAFLIFCAFVAFYAGFIDRRILRFTRSGLRGTGKLKQVASNLENSRWMTKAERDKNFKSYKFSKLKNVKKDGIPVMAELTQNGKDMDVSFQSPCHSIIIGSTGSGKTTTFVSPMIQLLGNTAAGSSMIVTDPKGELFNLHSKFLASRGYDVKVIDLRDTYSSYRWNPLEGIWNDYQDYLFCHNNAYLRKTPVGESKLKLADPPEAYENGGKWYEFCGTAYATYDHLVEGIKIHKKKVFDEVYEDLNDLVSILIPVENPKDPMWEKGARSIVLATLLGMLEDSADERLGMTKEKFNFFNMAKILQNSNGDYLELRNYFAGRSILSKALSLSKQVCDCAETTRASYMSIVYEKLTLFNDAGICALTSTSDFSSEQLAYKPTALFLKIPDEKDTRHNLASIFILNIYKTLIKVASAKESLSLDRNVYFIMDEFGNMPKIEKFDKFITVGRSRKIWFTMIIQSYAQLNNVYGDTVADIVKGNCGVKMFIGSNDMNTCKEYSELCGNITVVTTSTSGSTQGTDVNVSSQTQVRPLIYPSELQRLNHPGDIGHSIIVTFGNFPLKTHFSPSFNVPFYHMGKMDTSDTERLFDENAVLYEASARNKLIFAETQEENAQAGGKAVEEASPETESEQPQTQNEEIPVENNFEKELLRQWLAFKAEHRDADLTDFYRGMASTMNTAEKGNKK